MKPQLRWKISPHLSEAFIGDALLPSQRVGFVEEDQPLSGYRAGCIVFPEMQHFASEGKATLWVEYVLFDWFVQISAGASETGSISFLEPEVTP